MWQQSVPGTASYLKRHLQGWLLAAMIINTYKTEPKQNLSRALPITVWSMNPGSFAKPWLWFSQEHPGREVVMDYSGVLPRTFPSHKLRSDSPVINFRPGCMRTHCPVFKGPFSFSISVSLWNFPHDNWYEGSVPANSWLTSLPGWCQCRGFYFRLKKWLRSFEKCWCES